MNGGRRPDTSEGSPALAARGSRSKAGYANFLIGLRNVAIHESYLPTTIGHDGEVDR